MTLAVGIYQPRKRQEVEDLRRAVKAYRPDFTFQIGGYSAEGLAGTPHRIYRSLDRFLADLEQEGPIVDVVAIEMDTHAIPLERFVHVNHAAYLIGPNTGTIPREVLDRIGRIVQVETPGNVALNSATAAAVVLYTHHVSLPREAVA